MTEKEWILVGPGMTWQECVHNLATYIVMLEKRIKELEGKNQKSQDPHNEIPT